MLFLTLAWRKWLLRVSQIFFHLLHPEYLAFGSVSYEPCPKTNFLTIDFRWREGVPTSVLGSQPIIWLLSSSSWCPVTWVRLPSTNIYWYPLCDLHSFLTVTLWRLATVHSNGRIVLILFLSFQWDTTWHNSVYSSSYITIQFSVSTVSMSKTVQFQIIQFSISTQFKCKYSLMVKNISILSYTV